MSGMASTGIGSLGIKPVFQLNGVKAMPATTTVNRNKKVTSRFSRKYRTSLLNMVTYRYLQQPGRLL